MESYAIGILGGGQLGRMLLQEAISWDVPIKVLDPNPEAPCAAIATEFVLGALTDYQTVLDFGQNCQTISIEIENVNTEALEALEKQGKTVIPSPRTIRLIQDKRTQKQFYREHQIPTADFVLLEGKEELKQHLSRLPAVQKLGKEGYDGRGVQILRHENELNKGFEAPSLLEELADIQAEIAIMLARTPEGKIVTYPATEVVYHPEHNLVDYLLAPATIPAQVAARADGIARQVAEKMDFVGLLAVEMFWTKQDEIWVNEVAPRPHNSGHHSIEACKTSQYAQLLRILLGIAPGETRQTHTAMMVNLLGAEGHTGEASVQGWKALLEQPDTFPHLYGKKMTKPFRKMGHVTLIGDDIEALHERRRWITENVSVIARS